ncbi:18437_t:CDS:2 [Funneliformis geosporum]|uniref:18437_t:CDS:1 n=1 Tax=Funneliformis geosporum TaxID=1117311 RepID=A0A9W4SFJ2_9GLOM|nr:18437_t:CDS:2 [Funneliformis geosporum]
MKKIIIIGKKGVGKTALFQQLIKHYSSPEIEKKSIKLNPLINHAESLIKIKDNFYKLIDTPAFAFAPQTEIEKGIKFQTENLLKTGDLILFNKLDLASENDFHSCRVLQPQYFLTISAEKGINLTKLMTQITTLLPSSAGKNPNQKEKELKLLIFGPPNSGKSTLMNYLLKENRSLATSVAGTTQEPVITWAVIDATLPLTKQILQIINLGERHNKPLIIIINKCDLIADQKLLMEEIKNRLKSLGYVPIIYLSALHGEKIKSLLKVLAKILEQSQKKLSKKGLAEVVEKMLLYHPPKYFKGNKLKVYFAKQEPGLVQAFIFFVNNPRWAHFSYQRYIVNCLRKNLGLEYLPIKVIFKKSS